jgi:predicted Fe-S protein YdhL (DUF1289 family)
MADPARTGDPAYGIAAMQCPSPIPEVSAECPCVGHCTTALGDDVCRSCLRTLDEVTRWPQMSEEERRLVNRRLATARNPR